MVCVHPLAHTSIAIRHAPNRGSSSVVRERSRKLDPLAPP